ncbi:hypothetical protein JCM1841_005036 [Sporobolomyces salmonicolor]
MSGYGDPYRNPDTRHDQRPPPPHHHDRHPGRGGYGGAPYGARDDRRDDASQGGYGRDDGGRARHWEDDERNGGRDYKRGRYDEFDRPRDDHRPPYLPRDDYASQPHAAAPYYQQPPPYQQPDYASQQQPYRHDARPTPLPYDSAQAAARSPHAAAPRSGKPPVQPEAPSASVVLLGLPAHVQDVHLRHFLEDMGASIDSTTVIIDRATGISKRYGFAKFSSVEHARAFIEPNFPSVPWRERGMPGPDDGMRIKINYSQKSGGWREDQGATARLTDDQRRAAEGDHASSSFYINDGTRDIGSTPSQILLLRGLDPLTNEEEIVSALAKVGGRASGDVARGGVKKVMIVKDRASRQSWCFAFVQFSDVRLATEVLASAFNAHYHPSGFRVRASIIALSFCHENSFIPIYAKSDWSFRGEGGQQLAYWDDKGFVQPWVPPPPVPEPAGVRIPKGPKADEDAKVDKDMAAFFEEIEAEMPSELAAFPAAPAALESAVVAAAAPMPVATGPPANAPAALPAPGSVAPISIKPIAAILGVPKGKVEMQAELAAGPSSAPATPGPGNVLAPPAAPLGVKEKKSDLIVSRKAAGNIAKWNVKQKELKTVPAPSAPATTAPAAALAATPSPIHPQTQSQSPAPASTAPAYDDPEFEHGDPVTMVCLLCQRQFKTVEDLRKHNKLSALHKARHTLKPASRTNLNSPETVAACATRKAASLKKHAASTSASISATNASAQQPKYVDRAAARRETYSQPDHPEPPQKRKKFDAPETPKPAPEAPNKGGLEESNAGLKMLEKMGWSKGAGLGASGTGRVDPVQAAQFQQGVGLGAAKGVAVGAYDDTKKGYAERMRDKARERLNES